MGVLKSFFYDFKHEFTIDDKLIIILAISLFMPFILTIAAIVGISIYVLAKSNFGNNLRSVRHSYVLLLFGFYMLLISLINGNYLGAGISVGMLSLFVVLIYYRKYIHKSLFETMVDLMIVMSLVSVVYAIGEQFYYMHTVEKMTNFFDIQNKPEHRVHTFFLNANYYAMMIVFVEAMCIYKFMCLSTWKRRLFYVFVGVVNLFALFLTGGRIGWLCLALAILVMLVANRWYKTFIVSCVGIGAGIGVLSLKPGLIPRLAEKGLELGRRAQIYEAARLMIHDTWLFGQGPLTYYYRHGDYYALYVATYGSAHLKKLGIRAPHAHSMFLEPLISFGVVGSLILGWYLASLGKRMVRLFTRGIDHSLGALILGFVVITISFCIIDFPIFWVQTGGLFLLILSSSDIYKKDVE